MSLTPESPLPAPPAKVASTRGAADCREARRRPPGWATRSSGSLPSRRPLDRRSWPRLLVAVLVWRSWDSITVNGIAFFTTATGIRSRAIGISGRWRSSGARSHFGHRHAHRRAAWASARRLTWRRSPRTGSDARLVPRGDAGGHPQRRLRLLGAVRASPRSCKLLIARWAAPTRPASACCPPDLVLGIMIVPYVAAVSFDVIRAVPRSQRRGALALGATRWQTIRTVVLALRPAGHPRRLFPRPGPRPRRDDGRDHAHRQPARHQSSPLRQGQLHPQRHRQRVHRGHLRPVPVRPWWSWAWCCCWSASASAAWAGC